MTLKKYRYIGQDKEFTLKKKVGCVYHFTCGHWVTDNVLLDMELVSSQIKIDFDL